MAEMSTKRGERSEPPPAVERATVTRDGPLIRVTGLPDRLAARFSVETWEPVVGGGGVRGERRRRPLLQPGPGYGHVGQALVGAAGLEEPVIRLLLDNGIPLLH